MELAAMVKRGCVYLNLFTELGFYDAKMDRPIIYEDNAAAGILAMTDVLTSKSKNIELQFHKCKEMTQHRKIFDLYYLPSKHMLADMFTKAVSEKIFRYLSPQIRGVTGSMHKAAPMPFLECIRRLKMSKNKS